MGEISAPICVEEGGRDVSVDYYNRKSEEERREATEKGEGEPTLNEPALSLWFEEEGGENAVVIHSIFSWRRSRGRGDPVEGGGR